jgi:hypothetical protein
LIRPLVLTLAVAIALASCADLVVGPVDHSCPTKPWKGPDAGGCGPARG